MGCKANITLSQFPRQGSFLNKRVEAWFHFDSQNRIGGIIVRDDDEEPGKCIIRLDDGRYVLSTECQYGFPKEA